MPCRTRRVSSRNSSAHSIFPDGLARRRRASGVRIGAVHSEDPAGPGLRPGPSSHPDRPGRHHRLRQASVDEHPDLVVSVARRAAPFAAEAVFLGPGRGSRFRLKRFWRRGFSPPFFFLSSFSRRSPAGKSRPGRRGRKAGRTGGRRRRTYSSPPTSTRTASFASGASGGLPFASGKSTWWRCPPKSAIRCGPDFGVTLRR